jgi:uncharacterized protein YbaR (Trm112 family)
VTGWLRAALRCPACKGELREGNVPDAAPSAGGEASDTVPTVSEETDRALICPACRLAYPVLPAAEAGGVPIPVLLSQEAIQLP